MTVNIITVQNELLQVPADKALRLVISGKARFDSLIEGAALNEVLFNIQNFDAQSEPNAQLETRTDG